MRQVATLLMVVALTALLPPAAFAQEEVESVENQPAEEKHDNRFINWESYREATARSRAEDIPLLLHFMTDSDAYCRKMAREAYGDTKVIRYLNENFAMAMVNIEQVPAMARKYEVDGLPTLWFLDGEGKRLTHVPGIMSTERLLPLLEFIHTKAYETSGYDKWLEHRK